MFDFEKHCNIEKNKYLKWYTNIICKRIKCEPSGYCEKHHIIPKCIVENNAIVKLTAREHFIVHLLLPKFIKDILLQKKLIFALWGICHQHRESQKRIKVTGRTYENMKKDFSKRISGKDHWMKDPERRRKLSEKCKGRKASQDTKDKISKIMTGRKVTWGDKIGDANRNKKRTKEMNQAQSKMLKQSYENGEREKYWEGKKKEQLICKYCGEKCDSSNMIKWHNENSDCLKRLKKRQNKPGKRGSAKTHKRPPRNMECPICKKNYTDQYFKKIHSKKCC